MKKYQNKLTIIFLFLFVFYLILSLFYSLFDKVNVYAYSEETYQEAGLNFLKEQYAIKDLSYNSLEIEDTIELHDANDTVIAKMLIVERDNELDYVTLDFLVDDIIGFGLNSKDYLQKFYNKDKIYYAGMSSFAYIKNDIYYDIDGNVLDSDFFVDSLNNYKESAPKVVQSGSAGIMNWASVRTDVNANSSSVLNSAWDYIPDFSWTGLKADSNGNTASYFNQTTLNIQYNKTHTNSITGTCGPTAMTNMAVYFDWLGYSNALISKSAQSTFEWFITDLNWLNWTNNNWWTNTKNSFVNYAKNRGYGYDINNYTNPSINNFISQIGNDRPIYTYLNVNEEDTSTADGYRVWAHAVVTVGYEKFTYSYQVNNRWWLFGWHDNWVTKTEDYYYLRCVDGWSTSNSAQYIKYNYYSTYRAIAFKIK